MFGLMAPDNWVWTIRKCVIIDTLGDLTVDCDYCDDGVKAGWLFNNGYYREGDNVTVWIYSLNPSE